MLHKTNNDVFISKVRTILKLIFNFYCNKVFKYLDYNNLIQDGTEQFIRQYRTRLEIV